MSSSKSGCQFVQLKSNFWLESWKLRFVWVKTLKLKFSSSIFNETEKILESLPLSILEVNSIGKSKSQLNWKFNWEIELSFPSIEILMNWPPESQLDFQFWSIELPIYNSIEISILGKLNSIFKLNVQFNGWKDMPALAELRSAVLEVAKANFVLVPQSVLYICLIHVFIQSLPFQFLRALTASNFLVV